MKKLTLLFSLFLLTETALAEQLPVASSTNVIITIAPEDTSKVSSDLNIRKTGLAFNTASLVIHSKCDNEADDIDYTSAGSNIEDVTTLGTYQAPSTNKVRFKETTTPGVYEIHLANARFAVAGARSCFVRLEGPADTRDTIKEFPLIADAAAAVGSRTVAQLSANPGTGDSITYDTMLRALYQRFFHKFVDNGTEQAGYKANGSDKAFEANVGDTAGAYTRDANKTPD